MLNNPLALLIILATGCQLFKLTSATRMLVGGCYCPLFVVKRGGVFPRGTAMWMATFILATAPLQAADQILLRKLEIISNRVVTSFDEDGVRLDDGRVLAWDEIEKGTVARGQEEFDRLLAQVGSPLYRLRQRLNVGDYAGAGQPAEALWPLFRTRHGRSAYWVSVALLWARLAEGRREEAVVPCLKAIVEHQRARSQPTAASLPGPRQLVVEEGTGFCRDLLPLAWRADAAKRALEEVGSTIGHLPQPWPAAARVYYSTLAVAAGEYGRATAALDELDASAAPWRDVVAVQIAAQEKKTVPNVAVLADRWPTWSGTLRVAALQALGQYLVQQDSAAEQARGLLHLLRIAAEHEPGTDPEPAAAALYLAMITLDAQRDFESSVVLRREILDKFASTRIAKSLVEMNKQ